MGIQPDDRSTRDKLVTRRGFLTGIGAGAAGAASAVALEPGEAVAQFVHPTVEVRQDRFSRIFKELEPFADANDGVRDALRELGRPGGIMDAQDPLHEGPIRLITNPELSPGNLDSAAHTAGVTFFGQFLDHDMTFDLTSTLGVPTAPERSPNARTPALDLDSVYGRGPDEDRHLYSSRDRAKLRIASGGLFEDVPRSDDGTAIIADPRNDENMVIAGLQAAFIKFHNQVVDKLRREGVDRGVFENARQLVTWHYQWIILHEFLPTIVGAPVVTDILSRGRQFYRPRFGEQSIPVEFQGAVYRFGHTLVRPSYRANLLGDVDATGAPAPFFGFIFDPAGEGQDDPVDLRGGARARRRFIGWQTFFNFGGDQAANVRANKRIDTHISTPLFNLPLGAIASGDPPTALPQRNLLRHLTWGIPSGQSIARRMRLTPLSATQLEDLAQFGIGLEHSTPLWFYALREGELFGGGERLAGVGARIVGEVFIGLLQLDPRGYLAREPRWRPTLPSRVRGTFGIVDLLTFAEVDPASRGQ